MSSPTEEGRSPKRQRRSYSPASPAAEVKQSPVVQPPQTPPPSVHMSPEWQAQQLPAPAGDSRTGSVTFPTPPSTAGLHSQFTARGISSEGDVQTPSYENESQVGNRVDVDVAPSQTKKELEEDGQSMNESADAENRRSDHERHDVHAAASTTAAAPALPGVNVLYKLHTARKCSLRCPLTSS